MQKCNTNTNTTVTLARYAEADYLSQFCYPSHHQLHCLHLSRVEVLFLSKQTFFYLCFTKARGVEYCFNYKKKLYQNVSIGENKIFFIYLLTKVQKMTIQCLIDNAIMIFKSVLLSLKLIFFTIRQYNSFRKATKEKTINPSINTSMNMIISVLNEYIFSKNQVNSQSINVIYPKQLIVMSFCFWPTSLYV